MQSIPIQFLWQGDVLSNAVEYTASKSGQTSTFWNVVILEPARVANSYLPIIVLEIGPTENVFRAFLLIHLLSELMFSWPDISDIGYRIYQIYDV